MRPWTLLAALALLAASPAQALNPFVRFATSEGAFDVELCLDVSQRCARAAPATVGNFLTYVDRGDYTDSIVHRTVDGFVIQGGSYRLVGGVVNAIPTDPPVVSEFDGFSNRRGTLSVPLQGNGPTPCDTAENSGTSGWFVNVGENTGLDCGLFTVFGVVATGMQVVDAIEDLPRVNYNSSCLDAIFNPVPIAAAFTTAPVTEAFWAALEATLPAATCQDLPPVSEFANGLIRGDITRVPEPGAAAGGLAAALALAGQARRRRADVRR